MRNIIITDYIEYEDAQILVCRKPAGLPVQSARIGTMDMESALKNYLAQKEQKLPYLGIVHRLDQPVEGVVVFAKTQGAAKELSRQIAQGEMKKIYLAVTDREPAASKGTLLDYLIKDGRNNISRITAEATVGSKKAILDYEVLEQKEGRWLAEIHLHTGRHHQIRVQMAHAGMPLWGDGKYHSEPQTGRSLALCAYQLGFRHPKTKKNMVFTVKPKGEAFIEFETCQ